MRGGTAGALTSLLNGAWAIYLAFGAVNRPVGCPGGGCPATVLTYLPYLLMAVAVVLVTDSLACFFGPAFGYPVAASLSAGVAALVLLQWNVFGAPESALALALSLVAIVLDLFAMMSRGGIPEESHPLNLPVFG